MTTFADLEASAAFLAKQGVAGARLRNTFVRQAVREALEGGAGSLEQRLAWFKTLAGYRMLDSRSRAILRRTGSTARGIANGWLLLDPTLQSAFREGTLLPSSTLQRIRRAGLAA